MSFKKSAYVMNFFPLSCMVFCKDVLGEYCIFILNEYTCSRTHMFILMNSAYMDAYSWTRLFMLNLKPHQTQGHLSVYLLSPGFVFFNFAFRARILTVHDTHTHPSLGLILAKGLRSVFIFFYHEMSSPNVLKR